MFIILFIKIECEKQKLSSSIRSILPNSGQRTMIRGTPILKIKKLKEIFKIKVMLFNFNILAILSSMSTQPTPRYSKLNYLWAASN